ncbi:MAG: hypothetical protein FJ404_01230 [Verrucomicrobia bacterium]|nr:hypothetical protein [Verrucomicrobiota bacterium]
MISTPIGLAGLGLAFWGWQTGLFWVGLLAGLGLELTRLVRQPWQFTQKDLDQIWNFCVVLFLASIVFAFLLGEGGNALADVARENSAAHRLEAFRKSAQTMVTILSWLPLSFLPILAAQALGNRTGMDWSTFSWWLRLQRSGASSGSSPGVDVTWPFFALCLFASSAGNHRSLDFPIGFGLLLAWALGSQRPRHYRPAMWAACLATAIVVAGGLYLGLRGLQELDQKLQAALGAHLSGKKGFDPRQTRTALGTIGRVKTSGAILMRVQGPQVLLREASYNGFRHVQWSAPRQVFSGVFAQQDPGSWRLLDRRASRASVRVLRHAAEDKSLLAVPQGAVEIERLPVGQLETNALGVIQISDAPGFLQYDAFFDPGFTVESHPDAQDVEVPEIEKPALRALIEEAGLDGLDAS